MKIGIKVALAALALGHGVRSHGARLPLAIGVIGIASMLMAMTSSTASASEGSQLSTTRWRRRTGPR